MSQLPLRRHLKKGPPRSLASSTHSQGQIDIKWTLKIIMMILPTVFLCPLSFTRISPFCMYPAAFPSFLPMLNCKLWKWKMWSVCLVYYYIIHDSFSCLLFHFQLSKEDKRFGQKLNFYFWMFYWLYFARGHWFHHPYKIVWFHNNLEIPNKFFVCTYFNVFFMVIPNIVTKLQNFGIFPTILWQLLLSSAQAYRVERVNTLPWLPESSLCLACFRFCQRGGMIFSLSLMIETGLLGFILSISIEEWTCVYSLFLVLNFRTML